MIKAAAIFSDNMVLQRGKNVNIWGEGDEGALISAEIGNFSAQCRVEGGKWRIVLPPMEAGGPFELKISAKESLDDAAVTETRTFRNVMIGEVWLCGGQSNMELELQNCEGGKDELSTLTADIPVRFYYTNKMGTVEQAIEAEKTAGWGVCDPEGSKAWSAVGYFFARQLSAKLGVTVGLIGCNWGGTSASAWVDRKTLESRKDIRSYIDEYDKAVEGRSEAVQIKEYEEYQEYDRKWYERSLEVYKEDPDASWEKVCEICGENKWPGPMCCVNPFRPTGLFESMIMRVCPYTLKGFLYYQGESDDHKPASYYTLFTGLIALWRECWGDDELPFIAVQLPAFKYKKDPDYKHWCLIREAQMRAFKTVKNTGIAVITDCGELDNIHPVNKKTVGERLSLQAEALAYGLDVKAFGPLYRSYVFKDGGMELLFDNVPGGFVLKEGSLSGFEIAGADKEFYPADAEVRGGRIFISSKQVSEPQYARYNWFNYPETFIYNDTGIPLAPFRTSRNDEK